MVEVRGCRAAGRRLISVGRGEQSCTVQARRGASCKDGYGCKKRAESVRNGAETRLGGEGGCAERAEGDCEKDQAAMNPKGE